MKTLLVLRHAKSSWKDIALPDHDRPLNKRGKKDAPRMGKLLAKENLVPDHIISSTAKRATKTASKAAKACKFEGELCKDRRLYHADVQGILTLLRKLPDRFERVMIVGHNPDLEEVIESLTAMSEIFPTAAIAQISLPVESWKDLTLPIEGKLENLWRPRELSVE